MTNWLVQYYKDGKIHSANVGFKSLILNFISFTFFNDLQHFILLILMHCTRNDYKFKLCLVYLLNQLQTLKKEFISRNSQLFFMACSAMSRSNSPVQLGLEQMLPAWMS